MSKSKFAGSVLHRGFATDKDAEQNGVWRIHTDSGIAVKVRRSTLPDHKRALRKHYKPFAHLTRIDPADELRVKQKAAAEVLVADWGVVRFDDLKNPLRDEAGNYVIDPFEVNGEVMRATESNLYDAFVDMPDFFAWVSDEADTFEHYRIEAVADAGGNSSDTSTGNASGGTLQPPLSSSDAQHAEHPSPPSSNGQS
jgi:hypothetical protein